jgi:hypothetical protein
MAVKFSFVKLFAIIIEGWKEIEYEGDVTVEKFFFLKDTVITLINIGSHCLFFSLVTKR